MARCWYQWAMLWARVVASTPSPAGDGCVSTHGMALVDGSSLTSFLSSGIRSPILYLIANAGALPSSYTADGLHIRRDVLPTRAPRDKRPAVAPVPIAALLAVERHHGKHTPLSGA